MEQLSTKRKVMSKAQPLKQFADDLQRSIDSGAGEEELEEERRIAEEEE